MAAKKQHFGDLNKSNSSTTYRARKRALIPLRVKSIGRCGGILSPEWGKFLGHNTLF